MGILECSKISHNKGVFAVFHDFFLLPHVLLQVLSNDLFLLDAFHSINIRTICYFYKKDTSKLTCSQVFENDKVFNFKNLKSIFYLCFLLILDFHFLFVLRNYVLQSSPYWFGKILKFNDSDYAVFDTYDIVWGFVA